VFYNQEAEKEGHLHVIRRRIGTSFERHKETGKQEGATRNE